MCIRDRNYIDCNKTVKPLIWCFPCKIRSFFNTVVIFCFVLSSISFGVQCYLFYKNFDSSDPSNNPLNYYEYNEDLVEMGLAQPKKNANFNYRLLDQSPTEIEADQIRYTKNPRRFEKNKESHFKKKYYKFEDSSAKKNKKKLKITEKHGYHINTKDYPLFSFVGKIILFFLGPFFFFLNLFTIISICRKNYASVSCKIFAFFLITERLIELIIFVGAFFFFSFLTYFFYFETYNIIFCSVLGIIICFESLTIYWAVLIIECVNLHEYIKVKEISSLDMKHVNIL